MNSYHYVPCRRCGDDDHCACWHVACCYCGSKDHTATADEHSSSSEYEQEPYRVYAFPYDKTR